MPNGEQFASGRLMFGGSSIPIHDINVTATPPAVPLTDTLAFRRAQALNEWIRTTGYAQAGFIVGSSPDGSSVRVARLLDVNTTAVAYIDIPPELAEIAQTVKYALNRLMGQPAAKGQGQTHISWSASDGWLFTLQQMFGAGQVGLDPGNTFYVLGLDANGYRLVDLRMLGLTWLEQCAIAKGHQFRTLDRIPPFPPAVLDVEQARQAIERADQAFEI